MKNSNASTTNQVYQIITDRVIELLEKNIIPWHKPFSSAGSPKNFSSGKHYRGINALLLHCAEFETPFYLTFKQAKALGGSIKKGSKSLPVVFWKWYDHPSKKAQNGEPLRLPVLRYYRVFNIEQTEGIAYEKPEIIQNPDIEPIGTCEEMINNMPQKPEIIENEGGRAFYQPSLDRVSLPPMNHFKTVEEYYCTLFHELVHSTGHKDRLDRKEITEVNLFGDHSYSKEELVAEMGACFLQGEAGILHNTLENSAAYIKGWLKALKSDPKFLIQASGKAQKAADFILNRKPVYEQKTSEVAAA